jgi:hypothetical protein
MEVKGVSFESLRMFVLEKFGEKERDRWLNALSPNARDACANPIVSKWYPMKEYVESMKKICELFYDGDPHGAWDLGRSDASYGMKGIYKAFARVASTEFVLGRAKLILPLYYRPCKLEVIEKSKGHALLRITEFPEMDEFNELNIGGFIEGTGKICGAKNIRVEITNSLAKGGPYTEYEGSWG